MPTTSLRIRALLAAAVVSLAGGCGADETDDSTDVDVDVADADGQLGDVDADDAPDEGSACDGPADWEAALEVLSIYCTGCHSAALTGDARNGAPDGFNWDDESLVVRHRGRIQGAVFVDRAMPPTGALDPCDASVLSRYLSGLEEPACVPNCDGRACGDDGCDGSCGSCPEGSVCDELSGLCDTPECVPACEGRACGDDGCGGSCGTCEAGGTCDAFGACVCPPSCDGRACGDDGCGGSCGACDDGASCTDGACVCVPDCAGAECGDDGCGGSCGVCGDAFCETATRSCVEVCDANCDGLSCGDDGCGGSCGDCRDGLACSAGECVCVPACEGRACGDNGCGGSCGDCGDGFACDDGACECVPQCDGLSCGSDGCGGSCGECGPGTLCTGGACVAGPTWADIAPWIEADCVRCHSGSRPSAGMDLTDGPSVLVGVAVVGSGCGGRTRVVAGRPEDSYLVNKLTGTAICGSRMPRGGSAWPAERLQRVRDWIAAGALP